VSVWFPLPDSISAFKKSPSTEMHFSGKKKKKNCKSEGGISLALYAKKQF